ncbi:MAG: hypothetical protein WBC82_03615 [Dehalococcoidia bacterium]
MAKKKSSPLEKVFNNTEPMFYRGFPKYTEAEHEIKWDIGVGAYYDLIHRVENLEGAVKFIVPSRISTLKRVFEQYDVKDTMPAASSPVYEWHTQLNKVADIVENILEIFDDLDKRLNCYINLIKQVKDLLKLARSLENRNVRDVSLALHDAIHGTYSEDMTIKQVKAIQSIVKNLYDLNLSREQVRSFDRDLRKSGLETVPSDRFIGAYSEQRGT